MLRRLLLCLAVFLLLPTAAAFAQANDPVCVNGPFFDPASGPYDATDGTIEFCTPWQTEDGVDIDQSKYILDRCALETTTGAVLTTVPLPPFGTPVQATVPKDFIQDHPAELVCYITDVNATQPVARGTPLAATFRFPIATLGPAILLSPQ